MKKAAALFLCVILIFAFSIAVFAINESQVSPSAVSATWHIVGTNVNLRSGPGTNYSSGGLVQNGDRFNNLGLYVGTDGSYWRRCHMTSGANSGNTGYVLNTYTDYS